MNDTIAVLKLTKGTAIVHYANAQSRGKWFVNRGSLMGGMSE